VNDAKPEREFTRPAIGALAASIAAMGLGPTGLLLTTYSLFIQPMAATFGWSRSEATLPVTAAALAIAISSPIKGWLVQTFGPRRTILPLTLALGLATAGLALPGLSGPQVVALFVAIGLVAPGNVPFGQLIGDWFDRRRGAAYGLLGLGFTLITPIGLQLTRPLVDSVGWRTSYALFGALQFVVAMPLLWLHCHPRPAPSPAKDKPAASAVGLGVAEAWKSSAYWLLVGNLVLGVIVIAAFATQGAPILGELKIDRLAATNALSTMWIGMMLSQPVLGWLMDRWNSPRVALPFAVAAVTGILLLQARSGPWNAPISLFLVGLGCGGESGTTQYFVSRFFGLRRFGLIYGSIQPFTMVVGVAVGPWAAARLFDATGSYRLDLQLLTGALLAAGLLIVLLPRYKFTSEAQR